ncbi:hypothetical protein AWB61_15690 [Chromobacterium sp. F49]|nr:hypothetical protein Cv017_16855 [Chromobacterium subtsugae]KZE86442.1 hypothetical protein AWB61_15690 [Chromobacterium sp. F49]OBU85684.1 hypothetical protein MY55_14940 [Chromobacterium subtsugae]
MLIAIVKMSSIHGRNRLLLGRMYKNYFLMEQRLADTANCTLTCPPFQLVQLHIAQLKMIKSE